MNDIAINQEMFLCLSEFVKQTKNTKDSKQSRKLPFDAKIVQYNLQIKHYIILVLIFNFYFLWF